MSIVLSRPRLGNLARGWVVAGVIGLGSCVALTTTGCSTAVGRDLSSRTDILKTLREQGYLFNQYVISTVADNGNPNRVRVTGQIARKSPDEGHVKGGFKVTQIQYVVVENANGAWQVAEAPTLVRDQFTSRQRWD